MPETPEQKAKRLAERARVDGYAAKVRGQRKPKPKPKTAKPTASSKAKVRRDSITKAAAPSGFQALLRALGYKN